MSEQTIALEGVLAALGDGVVIRDADGRVVQANPRALELLGLSREELAGEPPAGFALTRVDGSALSTEDLPWVRVRHTGEPLRGVVLAVRSPRGTRRVLRVNAVQVADSGAVVTSLCDATDEHRQALDLVAAEARLLETSELGHLGTMDRDLKTGDLRVSPSLCRLLGVPLGTSRLEGLWARVVPEDVPELNLGLEAAGGGATVTRACRVRKEAGGLRHLRGWVSGRRGPSGAVERVTALFQDDTDQAALSNQLKLTERLASLGTLAAGIGHQINNPLTAVVSNAEAALSSVMRGGLTPEELSAALSDTLSAAERIRRVVGDLRAFDFEQPDRGQREPVRVETVMQLAADLAGNEVKHRATLKQDFQPTRPVMGQEPRLVELFLHLLVNAARAIDEGRASDNVITLSTRQEGDELLAAVHDTGRGMSADVVPHIFDAFFTTDSTGSSTGLGLFVCQGIATELGGRLEVTSELGQGTTFVLRVPTLDIPTPVTPPPLSPPRRGRILVVDDEPFVLRALERLLGKEHELVVFDDPKQALAAVAAGGTFDVFLCDIMMPDMSGMDVWEELAKVGPGLRDRMIFMTGGTFTDRSRAFVATHRPPLLDKPFSRAQLNAALRRLLGPAPRRNDD